MRRYKNSWKNNRKKLFKNNLFLLTLANTIQNYPTTFIKLNLPYFLSVVSDISNMILIKNKSSTSVSFLKINEPNYSK
jgi:hypothetical protein